MDSPPELVAFVLANSGIFLVSVLLAGLSFHAYRQSHGTRTFRLAGIGFGFVCLGGLVEPVYQLVVRGDPNLNGTELLWLQSGEGVLITIGLGLLFLSITRHSSEPPSTTDDHDPSTEGDRRPFSYLVSDD